MFVLAAPRSGSTLLFDLLDAHPDLWAWAGEATYGWLQLTPADHPVTDGDTWPVPMAGGPTRREAERLLFRLGVRSRVDRAGERPGLHGTLAHHRIRYLDKTPANSVRTAAIAALWPEARFVHLHRDGPSNVASLIESWDTWLGVRDPVLPDGRQVKWRMLLPQGWADHASASVAEKCAFQWVAANEAILDGLAGVDPARVRTVSYAELVADPHAVARDVCALAELPYAPEVADFCDRMPLSKVVVSAPRPDKWRDRYDELAPVLPMMAATSARLGYPA